MFPAALPTIFVGVRLGMIFALINIVGVEFLINYGGLGQLINDLRRTLRPGRHLCRDLLRHPRERPVLRVTGKDRKMAETGRLRQAAVVAPAVSPVTLLRVAIILSVLALWEFLAAFWLALSRRGPFADGDRACAHRAA